MKLSSKTALIALCLPAAAVCQTPGTVSNAPAMVSAAFLAQVTELAK